MAGPLLDFVIVVAAVVLWAVRYFFADLYPPARYIVGAVALIAILIKLKPVIGAAF